VPTKHYRPGDSGTPGPSWRTFIAQAKVSLWSVDLFRCESILLHSHWVRVVIDVFTRRFASFAGRHDPARKLEAFRDDYNGHRVHRALAGFTPAQRAGALCPAPLALDHYGWRRHWQGLFELPIAA